MNVNWKMEADTTGWLDRSGKLHHCEYLGHWNKAREIAKELFSFESEYDIEGLEDQGPLLDAAELLLEKGFVQIDIVGVFYRFFQEGYRTPRPLSRKQKTWIIDNIVLAKGCNKELVKSAEKCLRENEDFER